MRLEVKFAENEQRLATNFEESSQRVDTKFNSLQLVHGRDDWGQCDEHW